MTVPTTTNRATYTGNGVTTAFAYPGKIFDKTDLQVYVDGALKAVDADYTVDGVLSPNGGNVTFTSAPADGSNVVILRVVSLKQGTALSNQGAYDAASVETALDRLSEVDIQQEETMSRAARAPEGETTDMQLPAVATRAGKHLAFDSEGLPSMYDMRPLQAQADALDALTAAQGEAINRSVRAPESLDMSLPAAELRADKLMGFGPSGLPAALPLDTAAMALSAYDHIVENVTAVAGLAAPSSASTLYMRGRTIAGDGAHGTFIWQPGDQSANISADPLQGVFIAPLSDATGAGGAWKRLFNGGVFPEWFGAKGDGLRVDTDAIAAAITASGAGGAVHFSGGKTYLVDANIAPLDRQTLVGNGAILKRIDQVVTTTADALTAGETYTFTVADASGFRVGMNIIFNDGATYDNQGHTIGAIVDNSITINNALVTSFPNGATVSSGTYVIATHSVGVVIRGFEIDGNRANNAGFVHWELQGGIEVWGDRSKVEHCYIHDEVCEGIMLGGTASEVTGTTVINCGGNGIHFSGSSAAVVERNYVKNCNLLGTAPGHADGCIIFSNATGDSRVLNNYMENGIAGVGSINSDDNSGVIVSGNIIRNCQAVLDMVSFNAQNGRVIFAGNECYNSGSVLVVENATVAQGYDGTAGPYKTNINDNYFEDCTGRFLRAHSIRLSGNIWNYTLDTTEVVINLEDVTDFEFDDTVIGGGYGMFISTGENMQTRAKVGGRFINQYSYGVRSNQAGGVTVDGAVIRAESGKVDAANYAGILLSNDCEAHNCRLDIQSGKCGIQAPSAGTGVNGALISGNTIRSAVGIPSVIMFGGSTNNIVVNNFIQQPVSDAGTGNTTTPNFTIN